MTEHTARKSKFKVILLACIFILALSGAFLWISLKRGIEFDRIEFSSLSAEHITLQLDRGLVLSARQLSIQEAPSIQEPTPSPELYLARFNHVAFLVSEVRIDRIDFQEKTYQLVFRNNKFTLSGNDFELTTTLAYKKNKLLLDISSLELSQYAVSISGSGVYDRAANAVELSGEFTVPEVSGHFSFSQHKNLVRAEIKSNSFTDLQGILQRFPVDRELITWIRENISAQEYRLDKVKLTMAMQDGRPNLQTSLISGKGIATDAAIRFHPSLPPVTSRQIRIAYENGRLYFEPADPIYKRKSLSGSSVSITALLEDRPQMDINIQTETQLDNDVLELLGTYDIYLPLHQQKGITQANLHLLFDLPDFTLRTSGVFTTDESEWTCRNFPFKAVKAAVKLQDDLVIIQNASIEHKDMLKADLVGSIDTTTRKASLTASVSHLHIQDEGKDIVRAKNFRTPITVQFSEDEVNIHLLPLRTKITLSPDRRLISLNKLSKVRKHIPFLQNFPVQEGHATIDFTDMEHLTFEGSINTTVIPITLSGEPVTQYAFKGGKTAHQIKVSVNDGKISLRAADILYIRLHDYLLNVDTDTFGTKAGPSSPVPISIIGPASLIKLKNTAIPTRNFAADLAGSNVFYTAELDQGTFHFESKNGDMTITASDLDAQRAKDFFHFADLDGGRFDLSINGKNEENYEGFVEFSNVMIKDVAILNNVLSFINAVPALATFSSPGFDADGYRVEKGIAHFTMTNRLLTIQQLRTDGATINTEAEGWIDFENKILKMNMELISLKDYSKIIDMIPLAGYAILGEDGSLSTSLTISGKITEPVVSTNLSAEIVMMPINIIKRTIKWPFRLFNKIKDFVIESPEQVE